MLAFANDGNGREDHHRHCENDAHEARHDIHRGAAFRVVIRPDLDRRLFLLLAAGIECNRHVAQLIGNAKYGGVAAVDENMGGRTIGIDNAAIEVGWDRDADGNIAGAQKFLEVRNGVHPLLNERDLRFTNLGDKFTRQMRICLVRDCRLEVTDIGVDRVAEHQDLHQRHANYHCECQAIAPQLAHLFACDSHEAG